MADTFVCSCCGNEFVMTRPDVEAKAEYSQQFPNDSFADARIVCTGCFNMIMAYWNKKWGRLQ